MEQWHDHKPVFIKHTFLKACIRMLIPHLGAGFLGAGQLTQKPTHPKFLGQLTKFSGQFTQFSRQLT